MPEGPQAVVERLLAHDKIDVNQASGSGYTSISRMREEPRSGGGAAASP